MSCIRTIFRTCCRTFGALRLLFLLAACVAVVPANAQDSIPGDTCRKQGIVERLISYFDKSNKPKKNKRFDFSIIGGPHYSSDTKLGIGLVASGYYRSDRTDTLDLPSNVSLYGDISTTCFYMVGLRGNHLFPDDKYRIDYDLYFYSFPTKFWGIGYDCASLDSNETEYDDFRFKLISDFLVRMAPGLYAGPGLEFAHIKAKHLENPADWEGLPHSTTTFGFGIKVQYDTRDNLTAPQRGWLASVEQRFFPRFLGNEQAFSYTDFGVNFYRNVWMGCILAARFHTRYSYGNVPWGMLPSFGGSMSMRGYYDGRYRDKGELDLTVEFRQHVWRRSGVVLWGGIGSVFPKISEMRIGKLLPNIGIGYRWEFKKFSNVRLDFGIGRGETAFIFNIDEAF